MIMVSFINLNQEKKFTFHSFEDDLGNKNVLDPTTTTSRLFRTHHDHDHHSHPQSSTTPTNPYPSINENGKR